MILPSSLEKLCNSCSPISLNGATLRECFESLSKIEGDLAIQIYSESSLRPFLAVFINGIDHRQLGGLNTLLNENDEIVLVLAISGG